MPDKTNRENNCVNVPKRLKPKRGEVLDVHVESLAFGGAGVGRTETGLVIFVPGGLPGDELRVKITKKKKGFLEARIIEVIAPSPDRIEPRCEHFGLCGGCKWQHYPYALQLKAKEQQVLDHFQRIANVPAPPVEPVAGMDTPWGYRNKMEYTFSVFKDGDMKLGLHRPGFFDWIINIEKCLLQTETCDRIRNATRSFCYDHNLTTHNVRKHEGLLRNLVVRTADSGVMVCISTHTEEFAEYAEAYADFITCEIPDIKSLMWYVNPLLSGVALAGEARLLFGDSHIKENILGLELKVSPLSFMQTNTAQAEKLYETMLEFAGLEGGETVFDLYTGMAPIAMLAAGRAGRVVGIESVAEAVEDGEYNLRANGIDNVELIAGEVENVMPGLCEKTKPDLIIADPPRVGIHKKAVKAIIEVSARRIVYVSCNPSTLARDAAEFIAAGYELVRVRPVDMFPHTAHIECVALFDKPA